MGDEVSKEHFTAGDYRRFEQRLDAEMVFVRELFAERAFDNHNRCLGYELELCLIDAQGAPAPNNQQVLDAADNPLFTNELARFNLEINGHAFGLTPDVFDRVEQDQMGLYSEIEQQANRLGLKAGLFGVLPSIRHQHLEPGQYMSDMHRYHLLNDRLMEMRGQPVRLNIYGEEHLITEREDVMLEALGTSLQVHWQLPFEQSVDAYHAALWASIMVVGASANSPLVLGHSCWHESRIVIFKQSVDTRNPQEIRDSIIPRVHLSKGYISSFLELFEDNAYYSPILPEVIDTPVGDLHHFNLHNGTIWRWVRPILGQRDGEYHLRLELRVAPSGPTLADSLANLVFYLGLVEGLRTTGNVALTQIPYATLEHEFYEVARHGLNTEIGWFNGRMGKVRDILLQQALPLAQKGINSLGISNAERWLDIIQQRVASGQTGAVWTRQHWIRHADSNRLVNDYLQHAATAEPVHRWPEP
jgi:hypothetical protein